MIQKWISCLCAAALLVTAAPVAHGEDDVLLPADTQTTPAAETIMPDVDDPVLPGDTGEAAPLVPTAAPLVPIPAPEEMVLVGLAYGSSVMDGANLINGEGSGYRFGYLDDQRTFWQFGWTGETAISVVKTQNVWYYPEGGYTA